MRDDLRESIADAVLPFLDKAREEGKRCAVSTMGDAIRKAERERIVGALREDEHHRKAAYPSLSGDIYAEGLHKGYLFAADFIERMDP